MSFNCKACGGRHHTRKELSDCHKLHKDNEAAAEIGEDAPEEAPGEVVEKTPEEVLYEQIDDLLEDLLEDMPEVIVVPTKHVIPLDKCPPELKYLSSGHFVGLRVTGKYTKDGVVVEGVEMI